MDVTRWQGLATKLFPELQRHNLASAAPDPINLLESFAYLADEAHRLGDTALLDRIYPFIRWSIRNVESNSLKGWIADWFFARILQFPHSKSGCLDYLDWGDVELVTSHFTVEPMFEDTDNFERLSNEWRKRWSRNQKLPRPEFNDPG